MAAAIVMEVIATSALKASAQMTRWTPTLIMAVGYLAAFYFLGLTLKTIPVGISYAIWSGVGMVLISVVGALFFEEKPDLPAVIGMLLIIAGVLVIHLFSKMTGH